MYVPPKAKTSMQIWNLQGPGDSRRQAALMRRHAAAEASERKLLWAPHATAAHSVLCTTSCCAPGAPAVQHTPPPCLLASAEKRL